MLKNLKLFSLPEIEEKVLQFWKTHGIFKKSLAKNDSSTSSPRLSSGQAGQAPSADSMGSRQAGSGQTGQGKFVFYEGPPTANGRPGIHHLLARSFKDVIPRFKTMRGFFVPRKAGWDTHGLPVEIEAEKELGMKSKSEIEKFGIAEFNSRCKELIWKYRSDWEQLTNRMGFWLDLEHPYITYENNYMESVWWLMSQIHNNGYLKKLLKTVPWCTRCQTPLSSHELGQPGAYKLTKDPSLYIKVKIKNQKLKIPEYLLVWTTTPWTFPGNLAIAVHPKLTYTKYQLTNSATSAQEYVWAYNPPPAKDGQVITVMEKISGRKLVGIKYEPLYEIKNQKVKIKNAYEVRAAEFVSTEDGSGLVHIAPAFGEEDFKLMGIKEDLPITVDERGVMAKGFPGAGKYIKEADKDIVADLTKRGLLYALSTIEHEYPYCWRCNSALIYIVRLSWFIEMSKLRDTLLKENEKINWTPAHIRDGRFGEWLKEVKDWSISRNRYWGTPLPIWECEKCEKRIVAGSLADLNAHAAHQNRFFFVRHGEADHNTENRVASGPERGKHRSMLTEKGKLRAEQMASKLKKEKIDLIFTSPYQRTRDTARFIAKATKARTIVDGRLKEIQVGEFNTSPVAEYQGYFANKIDRFYVKPVGNSETLTEVRTRTMEFIRDINAKYKGKTIAVVSHGDPLWLLEGALRGLSDQEFFSSGLYPNPGEAHEVRVPNWPYDKKGLLDLHRPFIDSVLLACPECKKSMSRVKDVLDVWFDSGAMPFASVHFPFAQTQINEETKLSPKTIEEALKMLDFPADYISEAIDQTRGWFYTLLAISTLLGKGAPYKNVVCLGLVLDKNGQKMSKSKGNVVNPTEMMVKHGADAVRWYFYTMNDPGEPKRFNEEDLAKTTRKFILILYNSFVFWNSYGKRHETLKDRYEPNHVLDRWILSITNRLIAEVTKKIEAYQIGEAGRLIEQFTDDLSRWYIRRSRDRFQASARGNAHDANDWEAASFTLQTVLLTLSKLLAPFMPFFSEALYLAVGGVKESVHLEVWPEASQLVEDADLLRRMAEVRRLAAETLALRAEAKLKVRQPLASITLKSRDLEEEKQLLEILADEVNVKKVLFAAHSNGRASPSEAGGDPEIVLDTVLTPALKEEGVIRELARTIQGLRQNANYKMGDEIMLMIEAPDALFDIIQRSSIQLKKAVSAKELLMKRGEKFDAEFKGKVDEWEVWMGVRKV